MKIIFFGTDDFAGEILAHLIDQSIEIIGIVTRIDKPKGRNQKLSMSPVKELVLQKEMGHLLYQPTKASSDEFVKKVSSLKPDLFVVVSYGEIMKQNLLDVPKHGAINVHPSLLPKFRGPSPIQSAILAGEKETGVTIMEMALAMDAGDILRVAKTPISEEMTYEELKSNLIHLSKKIVLDVIKDFSSQKTIQKIPQDHSKASFTKKITPEICQIDWNLPAEQIHNLIRAASPKPGARCEIEVNGKKESLKILRSKVCRDKFGIAGEVLAFSKHEGFIIACEKDSLEVLELQPENKKLMLAKAYINGYPQPKVLV